MIDLEHFWKRWVNSARVVARSASGKHSGISGGAEFVPDVRRKRSSAFGTFVRDQPESRNRFIRQNISNYLPQVQYSDTLALLLD